MSRKCPSCGTSFPDAVFFCGHDGTITVAEQSAEDFDPRLGQQLGGYIVVARVADGAMGRVYEGRHPDTKARVAIKVLHEHVARDRIAVERFKREYETAAQLDHPHIVKVLEFGPTPEGSWFLTMEYLEGEELGQALRRDGALPVARIVRVLSQAGAALDVAHSFGVIHRDLKPDNIFLCRTSEGDSVRVLDFGSVKLQMETGPKLTALGTTLGSPYYMSPEQAMGQSDVDPRTDVFALSAILFEMLTGKVAFEGKSLAEILMKIVNAKPPDLATLAPHLPRAVDEVVRKGLQKEKGQRHAGAGALAAAFGAALGLVGGPETWGVMAQPELARALSGAPDVGARAAGGIPAPAPAPAASAGAFAPARAAATVPSPAAAPSPDDDWDLPRARATGGLPIWVWVAAAAVVVVALGAAAYLWLA